MWLVADIRNSVELPCGKICHDLDEREESLLGSRKAGKELESRGHEVKYRNTKPFNT